MACALLQAQVGVRVAVPVNGSSGWKLYDAWLGPLAIERGDYFVTDCLDTSMMSDGVEQRVTAAGGDRAMTGNAAARVMAQLGEQQGGKLIEESYSASRGLVVEGKDYYWFALVHPAVRAPWMDVMPPGGQDAPAIERDAAGCELRG